MKITKMIEILQKRRDEYGEVDVRVWDDENSTMSLNITINDFLSDSDGRFQGRVEHFVEINVDAEDE